MIVERARPPLRAMRRDPLLVDDRLVAERLGASALAPEVTRWARAWLVCWHARLVADDRYGLDEPWQIELALDTITSPKGGGDVERRRVVLRELVAAGVADADDVDSRRGVHVRLARTAFAEHPGAIEIDWGEVIARSDAEPAALLVMRALADLLVPPSALAAVPRRDLIERTGYQQKQVRVAIRRLIAADLLKAEGDVGTTARYQFTALSLGRAWGDAPTAVPALAPEPVAEQPVSRAAGRDATAPTAGDGIQLVIGGATLTIAAGAAFEIAAGLSARLELGPDGRPRLIVGRGNS